MCRSRVHGCDAARYDSAAPRLRHKLAQNSTSAHKSGTALRFSGHGLPQGAGGAQKLQVRQPEPRQKRQSVRESERTRHIQPTKSSQLRQATLRLACLKSAQKNKIHKSPLPRRIFAPQTHENVQF